MFDTKSSLAVAKGFKFEVRLLPNLDTTYIQVTQNVQKKIFFLKTEKKQQKNCDYILEVVCSYPEEEEEEEEEEETRIRTRMN